MSDRHDALAELVLISEEAGLYGLDLEDLAIAARIFRRDATDSGERTSLEDVAAEFDVDLDEV